ncbi:MAG TPA: molybdopterin cofactor-binding domain-containing protein [Solirubrobacteraceae bacterium]|jgi:isoquinoline 1-oxidoreductase beta subunit|nr:molybdopterin cofactor-binding domain-containing protein [Solirubrobacteraceae bacterium]
MSDLGDRGSTVLEADDDHTGGHSRREFVGYLLAGPILVAAAVHGLYPDSAQALPTVELPVDDFDLTDVLTASSDPTIPLLAVEVGKDNLVTFALPRAEVGQGLTTSVAMIIADEMGLPLDQVTVTLRDAQPDLLYNQLTGGSNSIHSLYSGVRQAAATASAQLNQAAARKFGGAASDYRIEDGVVVGTNGQSATLGELTELAAVSKTTPVRIRLKSASERTLIGTPQGRVDARDSVTGAKVFAMDLDVPNALATMLCRPPTINGTAKSLNNKTQILAMPGVSDVAVIPHTDFVPGGVAVRAQTFGQCIDAIGAMNVTWAPGPVANLSEADVLKTLQDAEIPLTPALPGSTLEQVFTFNFRPGDPLETCCAVADVRADSAEVWGSMKSPIYGQQQIATNLGLPQNAVVAHVVQGGGSFGRHLFNDAPFEAAACSRAFGNKPVRLMWSRTDNFRQGRTHPLNIHRVRITYESSNVLAYDERCTGVACDFTQGLGEAITANLVSFPEANFVGFSEAVFVLTANVPYNFGAVTQLLDEQYQVQQFNTSSVRNVYSPDTCTSTELMVDQLANALKMDPYEFRKAYLRVPRLLTVLEQAAQAGDWGRAMPAGTAQGIAVHQEYKGAAACLVEIDCTPATVNRVIPNGVGGPRVTKAVYVVDVGLPINPLGLQAQMMGGMMDGIAQALTYSMHLVNGAYLEGSWDNAFYTRQWNTPPDLQIIVMPETTGIPGGAGEFGVAATMAATACAYARATGTLPTSFPINHNQPLAFTPYPFEPSTPPSPTNGLTQAF